MVRNSEASAPLLRRLQAKWGLTYWRVQAVLLAFTLAGTTTVLLKGPVTGLVLSPETPQWQQWAIYLVVMVPLYHVLLLGYGTLLGQYDFFRSRLGAVTRGVTRREPRPGRAERR
jgi:hypothetical protein